VSNRCERCGYSPDDDEMARALREERAGPEPLSWAEDVSLRSHVTVREPEKPDDQTMRGAIGVQR
jgi:hypothetical protein